MTSIGQAAPRGPARRWLLATAIAGGVAVVPAMPGRTEAETETKRSPIFGVAIPAGYRQWEVIAPSHEAGLDELRVIVGNPTAMQAYQGASLPFPDGTMLVKLAWKHAPLAGIAGAFVPGAASTVQVMVKDSARYAATGGWGFGRFINGEPVDEAQHETCFACHDANVRGHDRVFTRFAP